MPVFFPLQRAVLGHVVADSHPRLRRTEHALGARLAFYSGGVVMNLLFALIAFPVVFAVGVDFEAPSWSKLVADVCAHTCTSHNVTVEWYASLTVICAATCHPRSKGRRRRCHRAVT